MILLILSILPSRLGFLLPSAVPLSSENRALDRPFPISRHLEIPASAIYSPLRKSTSWPTIPFVWPSLHPPLEIETGGGFPIDQMRLVRDKKRLIIGWPPYISAASPKVLVNASLILRNMSNVCARRLLDLQGKSSLLVTLRRMPRTSEEGANPTRTVQSLQPSVVGQPPTRGTSIATELLPRLTLHDLLFPVNFLGESCPKV
jgi:hypothetical protein